MRRFTKSFACCCAAFALATLSTAAVAENNPGYDAWAKFKPGSMAKYSQVTDAMGNKTEMEMTQTLVELTPEKAVVETKMSMTMQGQKMDMPAQKMDIPAAMPKVDPAQTPENMPKPKTEESTDKVDVGGKSYSCKLTKTTVDQGGMKSEVKTWTCTDIPGGMVKMEAVTSGETASKTTMMLTGCEMK